MKAGNAAAIFIPDGLPRILMTATGLWQKFLQPMGTNLGKQWMALQRRLSGYGPIITTTLFTVG